MDYGDLLTGVTAFVNRQNKQIQKLIVAASVKDGPKIANLV
jgi:hypothetical protein